MTLLSGPMAQPPRMRTKVKVHRILRSLPGSRQISWLRTVDKRTLARERLAGRDEREMLSVVRGSRGLCWTEPIDENHPLVTIAIPTFQRPDTLGRAIASALNQSYERLEILVIGDHTDDESARIATSTGDSRVRFVNLGHQGVYPTNPLHRNMVSGTAPMNAALALATGDWIANCDDDDELLPNHVQSLLAVAKARQLEFVYGKAEVIEHGLVAAPTEVIGAEPLRIRRITRGSVLYSMGLAFMRYDVECWRIGEPHDWNLWKRIERAGAHIGFHDEIVYRYHWS